MLSPEQSRFVSRRRLLSRTWLWCGGVVVLAWIGFGAWMLVRYPLISHPIRVIEWLGSESLVQSDAHTLAALTPIVMWVLFGVILSVLVISLGHARDQHKLVKIIDQLNSTSQHPSTDLPVEPPTR